MNFTRGQTHCASVVRTFIAINDGIALVAFIGDSRLGLILRIARESSGSLPTFGYLTFQTMRTAVELPALPNVVHDGELHGLGALRRASRGAAGRLQYVSAPHRHRPSGGCNAAIATRRRHHRDRYQNARRPTHPRYAQTASGPEIISPHPTASHNTTRADNPRTPSGHFKRRRSTRVDP
jgi:hypothetical protein